MKISDDQVKRWELVKDKIIALEHLPPGWDGNDAPAVPSRVVRATISWAEHLKSRNEEAPNDVYPLSDGNVILEWHKPGDEIRRIEVKDDGTAEEMISYPSSATKFRTMTWQPSSYIYWAVDKAALLRANAESREEIGDGYFSLAA
jgi:hypothetical protein